MKPGNHLFLWPVIAAGLLLGRFLALAEPPEAKFTIAIIPDSQQEVLKEGDSSLENRLQWLANNQKARIVKMVLHVGDLMNWDTPDHIQYERASAAFTVLDNAGVPYACALGNHDTAAVKVGGSAAPGNVNSNLRITTTYNTYFPLSRFKALQSVYEAGKVDNACHFFHAGGLDWLVINLELWARTGAVEWAEKVLEQHPHHNAIILTHSHLNGNGEIEQTKGGYGNNSPQYVFEHLRKYANVRFIFSGHTGTHGYRTDEGANGSTIYQFLQCYHDLANPVRLMEIDTKERSFKTWVYAPSTGEEKQDGSAMTVTNVSWVPAAMTVGEMRCEYTLNPIGIDTLKPRLSWTLVASERGQSQSAYQVRVASTPEALEQEDGLLWDSGRVASDQSAHVVYAGKELRSGSRCYWKVRAWDKQGQPSPWSRAALWQVGLLDSTDWKAEWIGAPGNVVTNPLPKDCPRLRKTFVLDKPVRRATVSVCGLGFYELYVNGEKADDRVLAPANTVYKRRLLFDTVEVTTKVKQGSNALGLWLGPGYSDDYSQYGWKWMDAKRAILQLDVVFEDGTTTTIVSDGSWRAGPSPLTFASLYDGEVYDAGLETPGWATAQFAEEKWQPVEVLKATAAKLTPNIMPPVGVSQTIRPISQTEPKPGVFVFDLGQNFAGWVRLRATGPRGTRIVLRHSELTGKDGMLDPWTNRRAKATDTFVLKGEGSEWYEPRFTYHGFRYVEVTGYPGRPTLDDVTGCVVHAAVEPAGTFVSSDPLLNRIQTNSAWSMRANFMSIPTDCSMRDERTPCQMDSLAYEDAALCHFRMDRYYTKWLGDISGGRGNPDWNGDMVFLPWRLYRHYGDLRILETHYANMRAFAESLGAKAPGNIYTNGFGDWCPPNKGTWDSYFGDVTDVNTSLYAAVVRIVGETAAVLGKADDATRFARQADEIGRSFNDKRFDATSAAYGDGSQTTAILPLALGLVPPERRAAVFGQLVSTIRGKDKGHLDTGIFGTRYLVDVLSDFGEADLALSMLLQPDYPGFGDQIAQGATTLWEQWSFKGGMNSHNHAMFAGVTSSFFTRLAGITPLKPGYAQVGIRPVLPGGLTFVEAAQETIKGRVAVRWQREGKTVVVNVTLPVNTTARVALPAATPQAVTESGKPVDQAAGVSFAGIEDGRTVFTIGSGDYHFVLASPTTE